MRTSTIISALSVLMSDPCAGYVPATGGLATINTARVATPQMVEAAPMRRVMAERNAAAAKQAVKQVPVSEKSPTQVIWDMAQGNARFVESRNVAQAPRSTEGLLNKLIDDPLNPTATQGIVLSCARSFAPVDAIFDAAPGDLQHLRVCGNVCQASDGAVGSLEYAVAFSKPPVLMVLGNSNSDIIEGAVKRAMIKAGRGDELPAGMPLMEGVSEEDLKIYDAVMVAAEDALLQKPQADLDELCEITGKLNVWKSIESLLTSSRLIAEGVTSGELAVHGAYFDVPSGKVSMMGEHPSQLDLLETLPTVEFARTASEAAVPAEEARAAMYAGNRRYAVGLGGQTKINDKNLMAKITEGGQNPIAIVLGCADSRAPIEILFDVRPGDLFVLRNAGNTCASAKGSVIGSAEYAIANLNTKYLVVTGHTKCGAVTAAVQTAIANVDTKTVAGSIGKVLDDILECAKEAITILPDATLAEQVTLCTKLNVFSTIKKVIDFSPIVKDSVVKGDLQLDGAVYDIFSGEVEWLGEHPDLEKLVDTSLPFYQFKNKPYVRASETFQVVGKTVEADNALKRLKRGNERFLAGTLMPSAMNTYETPTPFAIVLGGGEVRVPIETIFDVGPGELVVQRVMGNIAGRAGGTLFNSLEFAIAQYQPHVLVVLADSSSRIVEGALDQISGADIPSPAMQFIVDRVMVSAMRAMKQVTKDGASTAAGKDLGIQQITVELNAFYTIEQLLRSDIIRTAVLNGQIELHAAVLNAESGKVDFLGQHPALAAFTDKARYA